MLVIDNEKSEHGPQRRRDGIRRLLHCCCICGKLEIWGHGWTAYCSEREIDEERPIPKFCSETCKERGGPDAISVTEEMKRRAKDAEWRDPEPAYREATPHEKYLAAADEQRRDRERSERIRNQSNKMR